MNRLLIAGLMVVNIALAANPLVVATVLMEAGGEGRQGMQAVVNVIANRSRLDKMSYYEVVKKPKQFSCLNGIRDERKAIAIAKAKWPKQWRFAEELINLSEQWKLEDITNGAYFYQTKSCPVRPWHGALTAQIGNHNFYARK